MQFLAVADTDYIHLVRKVVDNDHWATYAITACSVDGKVEEGDLKAIERAIKRALPRVTVPDFDYTARPQEKLEVPLAERIADIRKRKAEDRARAAEKAQRRRRSSSRSGTRRSLSLR